MTNQTMKINDKELEFNSRQTILEVAQCNGIEIPTLCHLKGATPTGACRICIVEVEGARTLLASCATPAAAGMQVKTESPAVVEARRQILQLLLSSGNHNCAAAANNGSQWTSFQMKVQTEDGSSELCPVWGDCRLQDLAYRYQVSAEHFATTATRYPMETTNPFIIRDFSRCIQCGRCVQACTEIQVNNAISFGYRGAQSKVIAAGDRPLKDSDCVFCGECVQLCPVGALVEKDARQVVRPWQTGKIRTTCSYCGVGCQMYLHVKENIVVKVTGVDAPPNYGSLCVKGRFGYHFIGSPKRLTSPLIKENGRFRKASWDEAFNRVADRLAKIRDTHGSDSIGVLSSARMTNEDNYMAQKFARVVIKTNNVDHCARLCHASTVAGLAASFGSGAMTNPIADLAKADVILVTGSNTTETHPVISTYIKRAVKSGRTQLIVIDPRDIALSAHAVLKLTPRPGTDVAWINGLMHVILKEDLCNKAFIETRTEGFEQLEKSLEKYTPSFVESITGIAADQLETAARIYAKAGAGNIVYCMGITQHSTGTDNVKALANLAMLCGNLGIAGGGVNPLRGQNNVQGACDMGCLPNVYSGYQAVTETSIKKKMEDLWETTSLPDAAGLTVTEMIPKAMSGRIKALYIIGENPMVSDPDLNHTEKSLKRLEFLVVQDIFLSETARLADVVLPATCFAEKEGTFTNTERKVQRVRKAVEPPGQARDDWHILSDLAACMGAVMDYHGAEAVFDEIARVTPSYAGISYQRIETDGLVWPCPAPGHAGTPVLHAETFTRGLGKFHAVEFIPPVEVPDEDYPLVLTTGRVLYQYHTGTMTMKSEDLNKRAPECRVEICPDDALKIKITNGEMVCVASRRGTIQARATVTSKIVAGTVFIPFHYAVSAANRLTNSALDPVCAIPELKVCAVSVTPASKTPEEARL